ncbi:type VI secretion system contractile sheath small subunit [Enterobacter asburiae]|nr:type VI secretion system contractile sheath small subunit [Enterobacter asburiae]RNW00403.1 type VI secretion system contractile sheath small subunit [Enterobacter asburiae]
MADSFQNEVPKARINLKLDLHTGGASKKMELPLKLLVAGDFSNGQESEQISEREKVNITKNNFDSVLSEYSPKLNLTVKNTLSDDGGEENVQLTFQSMKDFTPEQVAAQIPEVLTPVQQDALTLRGTLPSTFITDTQQQLARLNKLPPDWNLSYSLQLLKQLQTLWPEEAKPLTMQWQQKFNAAALPVDAMNSWYQGMMTLQQLSHRLSSLDEQKGKYITVSELKSVVFSTIQSFNQTIPAEEQLRRLSQHPAGDALPEAEKTQLELRLKQLATRYAQIKQDSSAQ